MGTAPRTMGRDNPCPAPTWPPSAHRASAEPRTRQQRPHQRREHQPIKREGAAGHDCPTTPKQAHTSKHANTHANTPVAQTPNPATHRANTPTVSPSCHPHANTRAPTPNVWASKMCERGNPWQQRATGTNEAQTNNAGTQTAHTKARKQPRFAPCAVCARKGGQRERRPLTIAHARARGLLCLWACLRTFVGVFGLVGLGVWVFFGGVWRVFWFFDIFGL